MTDPVLKPGDVVEILTNRGHLPTAFLPGTLVTLERPGGWGNRGRWVAYGPHPRQQGKHMTNLVDERDVRLVTPAREEPYVSPVDLPEDGEEPEGPTPAYAAWQAAVAAAAEAESVPAVPPVRVLGDHWRLATDRELELAVGNLRFEKAQRAKEKADV